MRWDCAVERALSPTRETQWEKGKPRSREKAQASLDVVASAVTLLEKISRNSMTVSVMVTPTEPVLLMRLRYGAGELMASLRSPIQNSIVIRMVIPMNTLMR